MDPTQVTLRVAGIAALLFLALPMAGCAATSDGEGKPEARAVERYPLLDFEGQALPTNGDGDAYPSQYSAQGTATVRLDPDAATGRQSVAFVLESGKVYPHFNPFNTEGRRAGVTVGKGFAREYAEHPGQWRMNTFNRFAFWVEAPASAAQLRTDGRQNCEFGTYVKRIADMDAHSDETGGNHYYHFLNLPPTGTWTRVVLNMHPNHQRGGPGGKEWGNLLHPTGEPAYNYYDTFTRFYFEFLQAPRTYPATYRFDSFEFYREPYEENDDQIYSISATYVAAANRIVLSWFRNKADDAVKHEVRYAFSNIHEIGWDRATPAPDGLITPPGVGGYCGMVYDTTALPLGKGNGSAAKGRTLYLATKPENSALFSQISLPLDLPAPAL